MKVRYESIDLRDSKTVTLLVSTRLDECLLVAFDRLLSFPLSPSPGIGGCRVYALYLPLVKESGIEATRIGFL